MCFKAHKAFLKSLMLRGLGRFCPPVGCSLLSLSSPSLPEEIILLTRSRRLHCLKIRSFSSRSTSRSSSFLKTLSLMSIVKAYWETSCQLDMQFMNKLCHCVFQGNPGSDGLPGRDGSPGGKVRNHQHP